MPKHRPNRRRSSTRYQVAPTRLNPAGLLTVPITNDHQPPTNHLLPIVYPRNIWLDQLTGHPRQTYTACRRSGLIHVLYLRLRCQFWQGFLIAIPALAGGMSIDYLITHPKAAWSTDQLEESRLTYPCLFKARQSLIQSFLSAHHIDQRIYFTRPRP